jgi:glycosyltransferase involved in cell wall biosynthesis
MSLHVLSPHAEPPGGASAGGPVDEKAAASSGRQDSRRVVFIGALPPPVTGMTAMTQVIVEALEERAVVRRFNWSRGKPLKGWRWKLARAWGAARSLAGLAAAGPARGAKLYYAVSWGSGLFKDLVVAATARLFGYRLVLHHHTYPYIERRDWRVALLDRLVGVTGAHAVHCQQMHNDFLRQYNSRARFLYVPPTVVSQRLELLSPRPHEGFALGFLSNLTRAKGADDAMAVFDRLAEQRRDVRLILAGPCRTRADRRAIDDAMSRWPGLVDYRGPLYGREKSEFFADIDAFLFPSRSESWGIVLTEAMQAGCPVVARSCGCIPSIVRGNCGLVVDPHGDFVSSAVSHVIGWIDSPQAHRAAQAAARRRSAELNEEARRELPIFVEQVLELGRL